MMDRFFTRLLFLMAVLSACACKSYQTVPNGFMVKGYEYFVNIDEKLGIYLGDDFKENATWKGNKPPMSARKLSLRERKLLKKLGYNTDSYAVVFKNMVPMGYRLITLVNSSSVSRDGKEQLLDMGRMQRKVTDSGKWFYERIERKSNHIYHAVIPVSEKLFEEKYLSFIYVLPDESLYTEVESIVEANLSKYKRSYNSYGLKAVEGCPNDKEVYHYEYLIPEELTSDTDYMVLKATDSTDKLVYYTLLNPGIHIGAFRICAGDYTLQYTTLDGMVKWKQEIIIGE